LDDNRIYDSVDLRRLACFMAVAEELSFTKAATRLCIAQPWLSAQVRRLERDLGIVLLVRTTRHVELTDAGNDLLPVITRLIAEAANALDSIHRIRRGAEQKLRVGAPTYTYHSASRERLLALLTEKYPATDLEVRNGLSGQLLAQLRGHELDAIFVSAPFDDTGLSSRLVGRYRLVVALPPGHRLLEVDQLHPDAFRGETVVTFRRDSNPSLYDRRFGALGNSGARLVATAEVSTEAGAELTRQLQACFVVPLGLTDADPRNWQYQLRPLDIPDPYTELYLVIDPATPSVASARLWELSSQVFEQVDSLADLVSPTPSGTALVAGPRLATPWA
jgi:DNA-binding transcriptional LysR family regulator